MEEGRGQASNLSSVFLFPHELLGAGRFSELLCQAPVTSHRAAGVPASETARLSRSWNELCLQMGSVRQSLESPCAKARAGELVMPRGKQEGRC